MVQKTVFQFVCYDQLLWSHLVCFAFLDLFVENINGKIKLICQCNNICSAHFCFHYQYLCFWSFAIEEWNFCTWTKNKSIVLNEYCLTKSISSIRNYFPLLKNIFLDLEYHCTFIGLQLTAEAAENTTKYIFMLMVFGIKQPKNLLTFLFFLRRRSRIQK